MHIVLESMREDSFPYDEEGLLARHIKLNEEPPAEGGTPITTETITPFIASLADHTISWHTMWSTIPYTHKAMLGRTPSSFEIKVDYCGMLPVPMDWAVENESPAKFYQHCLPRTFRYINALTDTSQETLDYLNGQTPRTTDQWETAHFQSMTGQWRTKLVYLKRQASNLCL